MIGSFPHDFPRSPLLGAAQAATQGRTKEMDITSETVDGVSVVRPSGSIDVVTRSRLKDAPCLYSREEDVVFSLEEVSFLDSSGLSSLVQIIRNFRDGEKKFILVAPTQHVLTILQMTSIDQIVPILKSVEEAVDRIKENRND